MNTKLIPVTDYILRGAGWVPWLNFWILVYDRVTDYWEQLKQKKATSVNQGSFYSEIRDLLKNK